MTEILLAIDPGEVTGWSTWFYDEDKPLMRADYGLIRGGLEGFVSWMSVALTSIRPDIVVCEKFVQDGRTKKPNITPLPIEGALYAIMDALGIGRPIWQPNNMKAQVRDGALKRAGLWLEGDDPKISWKDADDVNDTQRHALGWAKSNDHEPTVALYWPPL